MYFDNVGGRPSRGSAAGRLQYRETVVDGLEHTPEALARMLAGKTTGKTLGARRPDLP